MAISGMCVSHPCPNRPVVQEEEECDSGCVVEGYTVPEEEEKKEKNTFSFKNIQNLKKVSLSNSVVKTLNFSSPSIQKQFNSSSLSSYLSSPSFFPSSFSSSSSLPSSSNNNTTIISIFSLKEVVVETLNQEGKEEVRRVCVVDDCAKYSTVSCVTHTEYKCVPVSDGCRFVFFDLFTILCSF
jgi:hypothetical protein